MITYVWLALIESQQAGTSTTHICGVLCNQKATSLLHTDATPYRNMTMIVLLCPKLQAICPTASMQWSENASVHVTQWGPIGPERYVPQPLKPHCTVETNEPGARLDVHQMRPE